MVLDRSRRLVEDFDKYTTRIYWGIRKPPQRSPKVWHPPSPGFIKLNFDAHLGEEGWVGLGVVARNAEGEVVLAGSRRMRGRWPAEIAECKAALFAVQLARKYGMDRIVIEGDSHVVINRLSKAAIHFSDLDGILEDVLFVSSHLDFVHWSHVRRDGNFVAHHLARVVPLGVEQVWVNHCPSVIYPYVLMDNLSHN